MTNKELSIYSKLYDVTENNLAGTGVEMGTCKDVFLKTAQVRPEYADLSLMYDVPADEYVQVMYSLILKRLITDEETDSWKARSFKTEQELKEVVGKTVIAFTERNVKKSVIANYVDSSEEASYSMGRVKKILKRITIKIKAIIPLKIKIALKRVYIKLVNRG